jgi:hypothetical protein|tara:strand:+ start:290 stop:949 length:660 start_codon:yes stop_codon:yes gene_type:complete
MAFKMKRPMIMGTPMHKHALKQANDDENLSEAARKGREAEANYAKKEAEKRKKEEEEANKKVKGTLDYAAAKEDDPNLEKHIAVRNDPNATEMEKAKAQDAINRAYGKGPTDRAEKLKAKQDAAAASKKEEPKKDSSKPAEKADTSKGTTVDKIAKGEKSEGAQKASGRMKPGDPGYMKLPESEKLKIQKAAKAKHKKALEAWRSGGRKGKRPQRKDYF